MVPTNDVSLQTGKMGNIVKNSISLKDLANN